MLDRPPNNYAGFRVLAVDADEGVVGGEALDHWTEA